MKADSSNISDAISSDTELPELDSVDFCTCCECLSFHLRPIKITFHVIRGIGICSPPLRGFT